MKKKIIKISFVLVLIMCFAFSAKIFAASVNITGDGSASPGGTVNLKVGGSFTGRVNVNVSNGSGNTSLWIENNTATISVKVGNSGSTVVTATTTEGTSDASGNEIGVISGSKTISIVQPTPVQPSNPTPAPAPSNNNTSNNTNTNKNTNVATNNTNKNTSSNTNKSTTNSNAKDSNVYLSTLQVNKEGLTPNFNKYKTSYAITVGEDVGSLNVTATPEVSTSKVSVSGNTDLKNGDNKIYVTVTAENGSKRVYTITVTKTGDPVKSNSYLENLIVENATMSPEFSKEVFEYDCGTVGASVKNLKILAFGENENVKVEIIGNDELKEGENTITVKVTSEDGTTTKEYTIKVKKDSSIVEEDKTEEINALENTDNNGFKAKIKRILDKLKNNWLLILMYVFCLLEFFEIIYLYRRQGKKTTKTTKKDEENIDANKKRAGANKFKE